MWNTVKKCWHFTGIINIWEVVYILILSIICDINIFHFLFLGLNRWNMHATLRRQQTFFVLDYRLAISVTDLSLYFPVLVPPKKKIFVFNFRKSRKGILVYIRSVTNCRNAPLKIYTSTELYNSDYCHLQSILLARLYTNLKLRSHF